MSQQEILLKIFEFVILVFSLSLHEAAHAWMASRLGDQTARMMGRVTLNPLRHIDPVGTVILPLIMLFGGAYGRFLVGWAKPTPVTTRNFKNIRRDDTLVTLAGPCSNLLAALVAFIALVILTKVSPVGMMAVRSVIVGVIDPEMMSSAAFPMAVIFYLTLVLNIFLAVFNLLPLPPLDGAQIVRNFLPYNALRIYDKMGLISLLLMLIIGAPLVNFFVSPALGIVNAILLAV
ncbi:site-2 protease family protein [Silvibacterium sp.]|uniref:site-2 protease family protein n=1 Tax=Silvibacterium sp. TaxID=1964179 RepID=UPI0039E5B106